MDNQDTFETFYAMGHRWEYYRINDYQHVNNKMWRVHCADKTDLTFYFEYDAHAKLFIALLKEAR